MYKHKIILESCLCLYEKILIQKSAMAGLYSRISFCIQWEAIIRENQPITETFEMYISKWF